MQTPILYNKSKAVIFLTVFTFLLLLLPVGHSYGQKIQFAKISSSDDVALNNIPRVSWSIPILFSVYEKNKYNPKKPPTYDNFYIKAGLNIKNEGVIYANDLKNVKMKHRALGIGPTISFVQEFTKNFAITAFGGLDYFFHYKEKTFVDKKRKNKTKFSEWNSNRINKLNYYAGIGFTVKDHILIYGEYYFRNFFNQNYDKVETATNSDGTTVTVITQPYKNLEVNKFNIGIAWSFGSKEHRRRKKHTIIIIDGNILNENSQDPEDLNYKSQ